MAADEAGIITVNIANSPNSQLVTNVSNSTIQGETNFTDTQAVENITLTNSTLTLNVNGQNVTISSQNGNIVISTQGQNVTLTSSPVPSTIVPLNITTAPSWLFLPAIVGFDQLGRTMTPDIYTFRLQVTDTKYYPAIDRLSAENMCNVFPNAFFTDFGIQQKVAVSYNGYDVTYSGGGMPFVPLQQYNGTGTIVNRQFEITFFIDSNHPSNTYLPDKYDNSGEQYLQQAVGYYLANYIQNAK